MLTVLGYLVRSITHREDADTDIVQKTLGIAANKESFDLGKPPRSHYHGIRCDAACVAIESLSGIGGD
jgi:hypothetical protein